MTTTTTRQIAMFGASAGCSLEALKLLVRRPANAEPVHVHVFCRNEQKIRDAFKAEDLPSSTASTKVTFFHGDALDAQSVQAFFRSIEGPLSEVTSSLGGYPELNKWNPFGPVQFAKGMEHICEESMRHIVHALQTIVAPRQADGKAPSLYVISSNGIGPSTHAALPFALKHTIYGAFLKHPHADKEKMEEFLHQQYGVQSNDFNKSPSAAQEALRSDRLVIIRPSLLTNGASRGTVRASDAALSSAWTVSRKDVGAFLAGDCLRLTSAISKTPVQGGHAFVISY